MRTVTWEEFSADPGKWVKASKDEPIRIIGSDGEPRMTISAPQASECDPAVMELRERLRVKEAEIERLQGELAEARHVIDMTHEILDELGVPRFEP